VHREILALKREEVTEGLKNCVLKIFINFYFSLDSINEIKIREITNKAP
jgi:hypothetical protein